VQRGVAMENDAFTWTDVQEIAWRLSEVHPDVDLLTVLFTALHRWITELPGFSGDPSGRYPAGRPT